MAPKKDGKKKAKKKAPAYLTEDAFLQPFGVKAGQLVRNSLGCTAVVLGVKAGGSELWVKYATGGQEAPLAPDGWAPCSASEQLQADMAARAREQQLLDNQWRVYNEAQAAAAAEAAKAAAKKKKKKAPEAAAAGGAAAGEAAAGDAEGQAAAAAI